MDDGCNQRKGTKPKQTVFTSFIDAIKLSCITSFRVHYASSDLTSNDHLRPEIHAV